MSSEPQTAVVTGSSSGIGLAVVRSLLADGWRVKGFDVAPSAVEHVNFSSVRVDLCDGAAAETAARGALDATALVHAAGLLRVGSLQDLSPSDGELMWRLHVDSVSRIARLILPAMAAARRGRVVLIGSRVARGMAGRSQYAATKDRKSVV